MTSETLKRTYQTWADHFQVAVDLFEQPGTTLFINEQRTAESFINLWQINAHVIVELAPAQIDEVQKIMVAFPADHRLTGRDFQTFWGQDRCEHFASKNYVLDLPTFRPFTPDARYTVRQLTSADQPAFDAFYAQCSEADKEEGDVALDHLSAFGVLDGTRIVAVSSAYEWRGFIDIGILTDPSYRRQGLGKAVVSACSLHHVTGDQVVIYRHDLVNIGSQGIAEGLNFLPCWGIESVRQTN